MGICYSKPYGKLNDRRLEEFEHALGGVLPNGYRRYLIVHNGGSWDKPLFNISKIQGNSLIHHVYGLHDGPSYQRLDVALERFRDRIPSWCLPIADDAGGNQICIGVLGPKRGRIYFWDHETNELIFVSQTFEQFLSSLLGIPACADEIGRIVENDDVAGLVKLVDAGFNIETLDENGRSLIERATIKAKPKIIIHLAQQGAEFRNALDLAKRNAEFFEKHKPIVDLLVRLKGVRGSE